MGVIATRQERGTGRGRPLYPMEMCIRETIRMDKDMAGYAIMQMSKQTHVHIYQLVADSMSYEPFPMYLESV